jgi:two-component system, response regulator RegA
MSVDSSGAPTGGGMTDQRDLLIIDDDAPFRDRLGRAMEKRGFVVTTAGSVAEATGLIRQTPPSYAVIDMRLEDGNGLDLVDLIHDLRPDARAIMLTGYGNLATAVSAVKRGAVDYLSKPADPGDVEKALLAPIDAQPAPPDNPMSADRVRWEHILRVYELCDRNVSETARRLNMHRRTLQRILAKRSPR